MNIQELTETTDRDLLQQVAVHRSSDAFQQLLSFSSFLKAVYHSKSAGGPTTTIATQKFADIACATITLTARNEVNIYYFDPTKGYALRGMKFYLAGTLYDQFAVQELTEVAHGIYYPTKGTTEVFFPEKFRSTYAASSAIANDPEFDPLIYTVLPERVPVYDMDAPGRPVRIAN